MDVVITGTDFLTATAVDFGVGITVKSFTVDSDTQITAVISIAAWAPVGPHNVGVTTPYGAAVLVGAFTVVGSSTATPGSGAKAQGWSGTIYSTSGDPIGNIAGWRRMIISRRVNAPDRVEVTLDGRHHAIPVLSTDCMVQFYRHNPALGILPYKEAEGFCRSQRHVWNDKGQYEFTSLFLGYEDLLDRRLLLGGDDEAYADGTYPAETVMKHVVSVQCGVSGTRKLLATAIQGMTVDADQARGADYGGYDIGQKLLAYLQELAETRDMAFRVVQDTQPGTFRFRAWPNPYGTDRTATGVVNGFNATGNIPVVFSQQRRNLTVLDYNFNRDGEGNVAVNGDSGTVISAASATDTPWNDREFWFRPGAGETAASAAARELAKMAAREDTPLDVLQTPQCAYGRHYFLGDLVTVYVAGQGIQKSLTKVITEVTITIERQQGKPDEQISVTLADRPVPFKGAVEEALMNLTARLGKLERS